MNRFPDSASRPRPAPQPVVVAGEVAAGAAPPDPAGVVIAFVVTTQVACVAVLFTGPVPVGDFRAQRGPTGSGGPPATPPRTVPELARAI